MKTSNNNSIAHTQNRKRIVLAGVLVLLVVGFCLATLSGCSVLSAYAAQGEPGQTNQGICRIYQDANSDGICDRCGSYCSGDLYCGQGNCQGNYQGDRLGSCQGSCQGSCHGQGNCQGQGNNQGAFGSGHQKGNAHNGSQR